MLVGMEGVVVKVREKIVSWGVESGFANADETEEAEIGMTK